VKRLLRAALRATSQRDSIDLSRVPALRILFIADVVGAPGRRALEARLKSLRDELEVDACVVNGENAADGIGITPRLAEQLLGMGVDAITLGNHAFRRTEIGPYLEASDRVVRPANTSRTTPGRGVVVVPTADGAPLGVINVLGSLFLHPATSMFEVIDELVEEARRETPVVLVDVHAEATSEKAALARWLDGRVTAVVGTHTHVQTSDATVLPKGTAFITDAGMTGPHDSVIGVESDLAIRRMRTGLPVRFETAQGGVRIEGALVTCDAETGRASSIEAIRVVVS
jgi:2',3'-cyclic-nucleotide 2'-phosphodiesterase